MDKTYVKLDDDLNSYSTLTASHGQISLSPGHKKNIKAFIRWKRDQIRLGIDPIMVIFLVANSSDFIKRYKHHDAYINKSKTITDTAKPYNFTDKIKRIKWYPTFINFLCAIPGRNIIPLSYICRPVSTNVPTASYGDFIEEYVDRSTLTGKAYLNNDVEVHTYIIKSTSGNPMVTANMLQNSQ